MPTIPGFQHYQPRKWLSISSLVTAHRCLRRFFYSSGCRLGEVGRPDTALNYGSAFHAAVPWILAHNDLGKALSEWRRVFAATPPDERRNESQATLSLAHYSATHKRGLCLFNLLDPPAGLLGISDETSPWEIPWAIDIGLDVPLVGRMDGLCEHRDTKELMVWELKTSSEMSARLMTGFELNPQTCGYPLAMSVLTGKKCYGTMMDFIGTKKNPEDTVHPVRVTDHMLSGFVDWARFWGQAILECEKNQNFPMEFSACTPYSMFGQPGYMCEYKNLCQTDDWTKLKQFYSVKPDRPFDLAAVKQVNVPTGA